MSDYWKKKLDELNKSNAKPSRYTTSANYWKNKMNELEEAEKKKKTQDIAPVKKTEDKKEEERTWFTKGAFDDGYQFGDISKTILGTATDVSENLTAGVLGIGEKVVDAGAYAVGGVGKLFNADEFADKTKEFIKKDLYNEEEIAKKIILGSEENSVLGEKSDSLVQSAGQLGATIGLQAVGVPWFVTTGLTGFGAEAENAFNEGATYGQAGLSATIAAGAEILTEKIGGGISFGGKTLSDVLTHRITTGISNKVVRTLTKLGVDMVGEGTEEVLSGVMGAVGQKITYADDKELSELFSKEDALESFIGGSVLGGGMGGINAVKARKHGVDYTSGLTDSEEKVVNKVFEDRVAEEEKNGKLTERQKAKIYDEVISDMEKGGISIDTIEEVLGGDRYSNYKSVADHQDAIQQEHDTLNRMKQGEMTGEQLDRLAELKEQIKTFKETNERDNLKSQLGEEVFGLAKDSRLVESYNERTKRGQAFEADYTKYDAKQQEVVKKATESGILNNTRRTHEFVDMIAKISADKGVLFDFTNNEKLKGSGFAVDGKTVNGFVTKDGVTLNIDSAKSLNSVVGHEITHVLEGTEFYNALQQTVLEYAQSKGDYDARVSSVRDLYRDVKDADVAGELTADLVGDYLFTDPDFVKNLSVKNRNVFQKVYDEIKYLCKVATAGSKEARELEKVKRAFEKAYKEGGKEQTDTKYSVSDSDGKQLSKEQQEYFKDSKVRDEAGNLKVMYHGTSNGGHTVFDPYGKAKYGLFGAGTYFTDNKEVAESYTNKGKGENKQVYETYLNIKNPIDMDAQADAELWKNALPDADFPESGTNEKFYRAMEEYFRDMEYPRWEAAETAMEVIEGMGFDGITHIGGGRFNKSDPTRHRVYIAFQPEQIKNIDNASPTESADIRYSLSSMANTFFGDENMSASEFARVDYKQTQGYKDYVDQCVNNYRQTRKDFDEGVARKEIEGAIDGIVQVAIAAKKAGYDIYDDSTKRSKRDSKNRLLFSSLEPNSDYFTSNDISTICDKRKNFAEIYDDIVRAEEAKGVPAGKRFFDNVDNYFYLHKLMADKGLTQPCRQCYVESMRKNLAPMASAFLRLVRETNPDNLANDQLYQQSGKNKGNLKVNNASTREFVITTLGEYDMSVNDLTVEMLTTEDGLAELKIRAPMIYEAFNSFYGQSKPKMPKSATPFRFGELTALLTNEKGEIKRSLVDRINSTGGFRLQSYSDFQIQNFTDTLQVLFEAGTLGLTGHAYTKVPAFLDATEGTNLKRNISIFMYKDGNEWKLDKNDSFPYDLEEIYEIVKSDKSGNTGIIAVSQNEDMSAWIMANDLVGYGIPFHKSGLKMGTVRDTIVREGGREIRGYSGTKDHTKQQTEVWASASADHKALTKVKNGINIYRFWDFDNKSNLSKNELIEKNVKAYIDACNEAGYLPKFREYVMNNGKVLNNVLEYSKRLGFVSEDATIDDISFEYKGYVIPYGYYKFLGDFGMFTPDGKASPHEVLSLKNYDFDKAVKFFEDSETLRRNEILQQFSNGEERQRYRDSDLTAEELQEIVKQKRREISSSVVAASLSRNGEQFAPARNLTYGKDIALTKQESEISAPVSEEESEVPVAETKELFPDDLAPVPEEDTERLDSLTDEDAPPEAEQHYQADTITVDDPFYDRDIGEVGNRKVKAYMYENPEVKPFFQQEAKGMLYDLRNSIKGERTYNSHMDYEYGSEYAWSGTKRHTTDDIAELLDVYNYTYDQIENGLNAIIEDNGAENNAISKRIEFMLNDRLMYGYNDVDGRPYEPNQDYINLLNEKQITEYSKEAFDAFMANADDYAPISEEIEEVAPVAEPVKAAPVAEKYEAIRPKPVKEPRMARATPEEQARAEILVEEPEVEKKKSNIMSMIRNNVLDKGMIFEDLSLATGNRELQARWNSTRYAESKAQKAMEKHLKPIIDTVNKSGKTKQFYEYLYHKHNIDRMTLADRYENTPNKPVFGDKVTAEVSMDAVAELEQANPEFKRWAEDVYAYNRQNRELLVEGGVISREVANLWEEMYPHFVPIRRVDDTGMNINVPLDTGRTGVNAPIKRATGGNSNILPLFDTLGQRTMQTYKAVAKNRFGVELKKTLGAKPIGSEGFDIDEAIDSVDTHEELLQEGKNGKKPTFTVFENGEKVTFEITDEMYDAMKPKSKGMAYTNKTLNWLNNARRGLLTEYNPAFMLTNPIKDTQDILMNSQHPAQTYKNLPKATFELFKKNGHWYQEYMENGGDQNTYFDNETNTFVEKERKGLAKLAGIPLDKISEANNFIERVPRLAEYIASREAGRSIDVAMLDAARVTTNFAAGGDLTKMLNRNGFTFLNASMQGAMQQVRNVREAKSEGLKGWATLAAKVAIAGLPSILLNNLLWDDDEDYEELSDYVKQNYYVVAKYGDGKFVRIPKGRALAVIQNGFEQMENFITGNDEVDLKTFGELVISNLAPNNPLENNLIAPVAQALRNETWYGEDLVPTRLQDLPAAEQYDESTDSISKWLGEKAGEMGIDISPYKINYLLDQYSGGIGDTFLPMLTSEAERGKNSLLAPVLDKFTTDSVMNNQNVSDFYDTKDELAVNANSGNATDEDILKSKFMNSVNSELGKLYGEKREIQNSDLPDDEKYEAVREIQRQIDEMAELSLHTYEDVNIEGDYGNIGDKYFHLNEEGEWQKLSADQTTKYLVTKDAEGSYATNGEVHYRWYEPGEDSDAEPGWRKITDDQLEKQREVTKGLDITPEEYWGNKEEYDYAYEHPENYAVAKAVGGYSAYRTYSSELYDIKADKDSNGKSISGSRKEKVADYINGLDADYYTKIILFKSEYNSEDTYNYEIIEYLNGREDISFEEEIAILRKLGFEVDNQGNISW